jgi:hypothetical protein
MLIAAATGIALLIAVVQLSRSGRLSFRYTMGWLGVAVIGVLSGLFVPVVEPVAKALGLSAAALLGLAALLFVSLIAVQLSISISGLQRQLRTVTEEVARLRRELEKFTAT